MQESSEEITLMEPLLISRGTAHWRELEDLVFELTARSTGLRKSLPDGIMIALSHLVRSMNCYYSNLIEGHNTHPIDIERALNDDYSSDPKKRDLQLEARAHITVQQWIDEGGMEKPATSLQSIQEIHRRFVELLPEDLLFVENPETEERIRIIPGALRERYVKVGRHVAVSPEALPRFLRRFEDAHARLGKVESVIAAATAHHRLLWLHPFLDGNGRVARLMSYAMLRQTLDTGGIWSVARGLARHEKIYKEHLASCDLPRRNDLDGRGSLSEEALAGFAKWFLRMCIDQVEFMERLMQPDRLRDRILMWADEEARASALPPKSRIVLEAILYRGVLPRAEVASILNTGERNARRVTSALLDQGVLASDSSRAPLRLAFPATLAAAWMPGLFPEK